MQLPVTKIAKSRAALLTLAAAAAISACGGSSTGPATAAPEPVVPPVVVPPSNFTISGTVSGLSGTVVLQNNAGTDVAISANGTFTLPTTVPAGSTYSVAISSQPFLEHCSVTNGSGTANADVANISVSCTNSLVVSTVAGTGSVGSQDGPGATVTFSGPGGVAVKADGTIYVSEYNGGRLRKIAPDGVVSTLVASGLTDAVAVTLIGDDIYVVVSDNNQIVKIPSGGSPVVFAGSGLAGGADAVGTAASFDRPYGMTSDSAGNLYVTEWRGNRIRKIAPDATVTTVAGSGVAGFADASGSAAMFNAPWAIALGADGNFYVGDYLNNRVRKITPAGDVTTLAGSGSSISTDGTGTAAGFNSAAGITAAADGSLFVTEHSGHRVRKVTLGGVVTTVAGTGTGGGADGQAATATFFTPSGIAAHPNGSLIVVENGGNRVRAIKAQ